MSRLTLPEDCSQQWEILLLLLSSEEKKIDRTGEDELEIMNYFYNNEGIRVILKQWLSQMNTTYAKKISDEDTAAKCNTIALLWRQRGNDSFRNNNIEESYKSYTKSVLYADTKGGMYSLALANRSAALLRMKRFNDCLSDIDLALNHGYPNDQKHKLYLRQADCYIELHQTDKAKAVLDLAKEQVQNLDLPRAHAADFDRYLKVLEKKLSLLGDVNASAEEFELPVCTGGENTDFVNASSMLELRSGESCGRHVVAAAAARRGDVLFVEEPYACVALPADGDLALVCEACCRKELNPVPCEHCSRAVYCGERCRGVAWRAHHRWECAGARARLFPTIGIAHLALRVLLVSIDKGFPSVPESTPATAADLFRVYSNVDRVQIYRRDGHPFYRMFNLVTNFDKMNNADYIQYALTATMLTLYLESQPSFLSHLSPSLPRPLPPQQLKLFVAAMLLRSLGQLVCNGHAALSLCTLDDSDSSGSSRTVSEREVRHATAIYPSAAMMNHSCDPNIINTFHRSRLVVRGARELPAGTEVFNCYGPHRAREPHAQRRAQLRAQYMFSCACDACSDKDRKDFVLLFSAYACPACKGPVLGGRRAQCTQCRRCDVDLERAHAQLSRADDMTAQAERAKTPEARCSQLAAALRLRQQAWHRHHAELRHAADHLARLYADIGEYSKSVELIKQNIQSLEYQYGSFSVEVAHDLRKLADVMLERIIHSAQHPDHREWCLEAHKIIKKAAQLLELNYGSWEPLVQRLGRQAAAVAAALEDSREPGAPDCVHRTLHYNLKI